MEPTYITFEQAKWLKEKGFKNIEIDYGLNQMLNNCNPPEQWQVVEWLRVNHGIWVYVKLGYGYEFVIQKLAVPFEIIYTDGTFKSPQEAYSAAFDYIKEIILQKNLEN